MAGGWEAPTVTSLSRAPVAWSETALFEYLRHGYGAQHGRASGPMAPVVQQLAQRPETDVRAMATYLASVDERRNGASAEGLPRGDAEAAARLVAQSNTPGAAPLHDRLRRLPPRRQRPAAALGHNIALALNSNLHSERPDNLLRVILEGIREPATNDIGFMPAFRNHLDDAQLGQLAAYMRQRFAPHKPAWQGLKAQAGHLRAMPPH